MNLSYWICRFFRQTGVQILIICIPWLVSPAYAKKPLLSALSQLPHNAVIPEDYYDYYQPSEIAQALIKRLTQIETNQSLSKNQESIDSALGLEIRLYRTSSMQTIEGLLEYGFLNFHQTGRSGAIPIDRTPREAQLLGVEVDSVRHLNPVAEYLKPKYAGVRYKNASRAREQSTDPT